MYSISTLSFLFLVFISSASATSWVAYPVRDQYPLIARVGQPYSWSISPETFATDSSSNLTIVASGLPAWLSFSNYTFSGNPNVTDEGSLNVTLEANGARDSFTLCVTRFPPPKPNISISNQFNTSNPSMSSVFPVGSGSALKTDNPGLRVPLRWSFSIGFDPATFVNQMDLFYYAQLANGSRLPDWLKFDNKTATFDGVARTPPLNDGEKIELVLIATDQEGYSAVRAPFDLFVANHDLSLSRNPVLNVTSGQDFRLDLRQDSLFFDDLTVDDTPFQTDNISSLSADTSRADWLSYDSNTFTLSGLPPSSGTFSIPMSLKAFNQTISLNPTVLVVPLFFVNAVLPEASTKLGTDFYLDLSRYISQEPYFNGHNVSMTANSSASLNVTMRRDGKYVLSGHIPSNPGSSHIDVQLTAVDHTTHAVSHAVLRISYHTLSSDAARRDAIARHRRLILGLSIGLGGAACLVLLACSLALIRKYCRAEDTARGPFSPEEKGGEMTVPDLEEGGGYGWSEKVGLGLSDFEPTSRLKYKGRGIGYTPSPKSSSPKRTTKGAFFKNVKAAVSNFSSSYAGGSHRKSVISKPVLMFTKDSADNIRALRVAAGLDENGCADSAPDSLDVPPGDGISLGLSSGLGSSPTSTTGHSNETGKVSIPRQRPDFGPARTGQHNRTRSASQAPTSSARRLHHARHRSTDSQATRSSRDRERDAELAEAVIVTASRATSLRSARSSAYSYDPSTYTRDSMHGSNVVQLARPRLVPFTNARGVPIPVPTATSMAGPAGPREQRRVSHVAALVSPEAITASKGVGQDTDADAIMTDGLRYVRAFGDQNAALEPTRPPNLGRQSPAPGLNSKRSSRSSSRNQDVVSTTQTQSSYVFPSPSQSMESSVKRTGDGGSRGSRGSRGSLMMSRILVRTGEAFAFKYPVSLSAPSNASTSTEHNLIARPLYGGSELPSFLTCAVSKATSSSSGSGSIKKRRMRYEVEFWGTPSTKDIGEVIVGIFTEDNNAECVGRLVVEVVPRGG